MTTKREEDTKVAIITALEFCDVVDFYATKSKAKNVRTLLTKALIKLRDHLNEMDLSKPCVPYRPEPPTCR